MSEERYSLYHHMGSFSASSQATDDDIAQTRSEAISRIGSMSDACIPFFTKEAIQEVYQQMKNSKKAGQKISVKGLDGGKVDFTVEVGSILQRSDLDSEYIVKKPYIHYRCLQALMSFDDPLDDDLVYCNLLICHRTVLQSKVTGEILHPFPIQSCEETEQFITESVEVWEASEPCKQLRSTLATIAKDRSFGISKILGLACGPVSPGRTDHMARRSVIQHALLLTMQDVLIDSKRTGDQATCYAQDPAYTCVDRSALEKSGITLLDDPQAWLEVDDSTAVFSCAPDVPIRQIISDLAQPAIMIWDTERGKDTIEGYLVTDPGSPRLIEMLHNFYDEVEFPGDKEHFGDLTIHVRRQDL